MTGYRTQPNADQPDRCPSIDPYDTLQCGRRIHDDDQCQFGGIAWRKGTPRHVSDRERAETAEAEVERLREDMAEYDQLLTRQGQLLTAAVNALRGDPPPLTTWSHHDVAELAAAAVARAEVAERALADERAKVAWFALAGPEPKPTEGVFEQILADPAHDFGPITARLCDDDGAVRRGLFHHGTDYACTGAAHHRGARLVCDNPIHWPKPTDVVSDYLDRLRSMDPSVSLAKHIDEVEAERTVCPECVQGKHANCDGTAWDETADAPTSCTCPASDHQGGDDRG